METAGLPLKHVFGKVCKSTRYTREAFIWIYSLLHCKINHLESSPILIIPYCILVTYVSFMFDVGNVRQSQQLLVQICSSFKYDMKEKQ